MAKITIIREDGRVGVDGEFRPVDLSDMAAGIHAVQYDDVTGRGEVEFTDNRPNQPIKGQNGFAQFDKYRRRWHDNAPEPPEPPDPRLARRARLKQQAVEVAVEKLAPGLMEDIDNDRITDERALRNSTKWRVPGASQ